MLNRFEPRAHRGQNARDGFGEAVRFGARQCGLRTPQQQGHKCQIPPGVALRTVQAFGLHHLGQRHHIGPRAGDEVQNVLRHLLQIRQLADIGRNLFGQHFTLFGLQQHFFFGLLLGLDLLRLGVPGRMQRLEHRVKRPRILNFRGSQMLDRLVQQAHELAEPLRALGVESKTALGQLIQQPPRRMRLVGEEAPVMLHQLLDRRFEVLHRALNRGKQAPILRNVVHHAAHHFDGNSRRIGLAIHRGRVGNHIRYRGSARSAPVCASCRRTAGQASHQAFELGHVLHRLGDGTGGEIPTGLARQSRLRTGTTAARVGPCGVQADGLRYPSSIGARIEGIGVTTACQHLAQDAHGQQGLLGCRGNGCLLRFTLPAGRSAHAPPVRSRHAVLTHGGSHGMPTVAGRRAPAIAGVLVGSTVAAASSPP